MYMAYVYSTSLFFWTFLDGEKESAGYKGMLQAPTQAFLAETEGGEITRKP